MTPEAILSSQLFFDTSHSLYCFPGISGKHFFVSVIVVWLFSTKNLQHWGSVDYWNFLMILVPNYGKLEIINVDTRLYTNLRWKVGISSIYIWIPNIKTIDNSQHWNNAQETSKGPHIFQIFSANPPPKPPSWKTCFAGLLKTKKLNFCT